MGSRPSLVLTMLVIMLAPAAAQASSAAQRLPTKSQAEVHVLRVTAGTWKASRMPGLVDPRTHLLANNSQALCHGQGSRQSGGRYARFNCVVRPLHHRPRQGLYISYRVLASGRSEVHWIAYRMRKRFAHQVLDADPDTANTWPCGS
jgi:hypothetical protein